MDSSQAREAVASFPNGLVNLVSELSGISTEFAEPVAVDHTWGNVRIRGALQWTYGTEVESLVLSFANEVRTRGGGKHVTGLLRAIDEAGRPGLWSPREGLVAAIAVHAPRKELVFKGPTKDVLATDGLDVAVYDAVLGGNSRCEGHQVMREPRWATVLAVALCACAPACGRSTSSSVFPVASQEP